MAGKIIAFAIAHYGILPQFFGERLFKIMILQDDPTPSVDDIVDVELREKVQKVYLIL